MNLRRDFYDAFDFPVIRFVGEKKHNGVKNISINTIILAAPQKT